MEQDGTEADCLNGVPTYDAWYEMYGDNNVNDGYEVELSTSTYPVTPGDAMTASVSLTGSTWTLAISDATAGWQFSIPIASPSPAPEQVSAEWILERPEIERLAVFALGLRQRGVQRRDRHRQRDQRPDLVFFERAAPDGRLEHDILASPGTLVSGGSGFTVTWDGSN